MGSVTNIRPVGSKRGRPSEDEKQQRIDHLIALTTRIFVEEGYGAVTTRRISEAAGISAKSIYAWFPDKLALLTEVLNRLSARLQSNRASVALTELSLEEALYRQARCMIEDLLQPESVAVARFLNREGHRYPEFRTVVRNQNLSLNVAAIQGILAGKLPGKSSSELQEAAMLFSYLVLGELSRSIVHDLDLPSAARVEDYARRAVRIFAFGASAL
jgi:AcrR family transcriptional regulator